MTLEEFKSNSAVIAALKRPRSVRSILNYICACDTSDRFARENLNTEEWVAPLLKIWFASGTALDDFCRPFRKVIRELKADPPTLIGGEWDSLEGKVAKVLLADQLSRSCFRGTLESFSFDIIGRELVHDLFKQDSLEETLKLPAAILYLLPWALAHSEEIKDLQRACEVIDIAITAYPQFKLFAGRNKQAVEQHRQVLKKFGRYPQRNAQFNRTSSPEEIEWLDDKKNLPIWAGGTLAIDQPIK